jgi:WD40 repeat protein
MKEDREKLIIQSECKSNKKLFIAIYRVYSVLYSMDDRYVISGSDDTNIRFWKSNANDPIKLVSSINNFTLSF